MSKLIQKIQNDQYEDLSRQELIQAIKDLKSRISLITDYTISLITDYDQCEMDESYERDNVSSEICDVCDDD